MTHVCDRREINQSNCLEAPDTVDGGQKEKVRSCTDLLEAKSLPGGEGSERAGTSPSHWEHMPGLAVKNDHPGVILADDRCRLVRVPGGTIIYRPGGDITGLIMQR